MPKPFRETLADVMKSARPFFDAWHKHEQAPRKVCSECQFESSVGYDESHAPGCTRQGSK